MDWNKQKERIYIGELTGRHLRAFMAYGGRIGARTRLDAIRRLIETTPDWKALDGSSSILSDPGASGGQGNSETFSSPSSKGDGGLSSAAIPDF